MCIEYRLEIRDAPLTGGDPTSFWISKALEVKITDPAGV